MISWQAPREARVHDCRLPFDGLVELTRARCCELTLKPGDDLQRQVDTAIRSSAAQGIVGLHIRFAAGRFQLDAPLRMQALKRGDLTVSGCGLATQLKVTGWEAAIVAIGWEHTTVTDLSIAGGTGAASDSIQHIGGALTILESDFTAVERIVASCEGGSRRAASCVTIRNARSAASARVQGCELQVGANQVGALVVNAQRATVDHNMVGLRAGESIREEITRRMLLSNVRMGTADPWRDRYQVSPSRAGGSATVAPGYTMWFVTEPGLVEPWSSAIGSWASNEFSDAERRRLRRLIAQALMQILHDRVAGPLSADAMRQFREWIKARIANPRPAAIAAGQGIVVAGVVADDIRVLHNTITDTTEGIRIGLSARGPRAVHLVADRVQIVGNTIEHRVPVDLAPTHAGIFVGNVGAATIRDNHVRCVREEVRISNESHPTTRAAEAIRVWGVPGGAEGHFLSIAGNITRHASIGINVVQVRPPTSDALCQITQNLVVDAQTPIRAPATASFGVDNVL
jgi:nitrous oxidase accessory protein NosD